ncbi:hypothetical protein [Evansella tamaricis]|uniref:ATP-grasp domain-containing protein n=1 Tax=Evansella tamaricis TaxID=2069301 RepID=A0ABS6JJN1_9BACI|nr:hypothetical protein [Evansella tamaricis]MBU9713748.1 hypothetical protein [Evansella tamaricis]
MSNKMLFIYNHVSRQNMTEELKECASDITVSTIKNALSLLSYDVISINLMNEQQLRETIEYHSPITCAFVIAEGFLSEPSSLYDGSGALSIRQILESYSIPYTHSTPKTMEFCRNKDLTYKILGETEILIPKFISFSSPHLTEKEMIEAEISVGYPMFIKPAGGGNSLGIDELSICENRNDLVKKIGQLQELFGEQPILMESYISGSEFTVAVVGNASPTVLPIIEFPNDVQVRSHAVKAGEYEKRDSFRLLSPHEGKGSEIAEIALKVYQGIQGKDMIRLDLKMDQFGNLFVIDVNGTPSLSSKGSVAYMIETLDISMEDFLGYMVYEVTRGKSFVSEHVEEVWKSVSKKLISVDAQVVA